MQSIGERLEEARKRKGISIREAAEATKIRSDYLHKFESNQYDIKLPEIYIRGFLRNYANFLKVPADKILNDYNGLGLGENKTTRGISREVYGRMDISVGSKMDKEPHSGAAATAPGENDAETAVKNPATFVPPRPASGGGIGIPIRTDLLIVGGIVAVVVVLLVLFGIWLLRPSARPAGTGTVATAAVEPVWVKPKAGEPELVLIAKDAVFVTVTMKTNGTSLYQGTIPRGERRAVPRRGALHITAEPKQNLIMEIGGKSWPMPEETSSADIRAP